MANHKGNVMIDFFGEGSIKFVSDISEVFGLWF